MSGPGHRPGGGRTARLPRGSGAAAAPLCPRLLGRRYRGGDSGVVHHWGHGSPDRRGHSRSLGCRPLRRGPIEDRRVAGPREARRLRRRMQRCRRALGRHRRCRRRLHGRLRPLGRPGRGPGCSLERRPRQRQEYRPTGRAGGNTFALSLAPLSLWKGRRASPELAEGAVLRLLGSAQ